jgi:hypothetical protein
MKFLLIAFLAGFGLVGCTGKGDKDDSADTAAE